MKKIYWLLPAFLAISTVTHGQWRHLLGPEGGKALALDKDGAKLYALAESGVYQSDDEGLHWDLLRGSMQPGLNLKTIQVENGVFYATNWFHKLFRSTDGCKHWAPMLDQTPMNYLLDEQLNGVFANGDTVLVPGNYTIYRSVNRGVDWVATGDFFGFDLSRLFYLNGEYFAWGGRSVFRSSDGGQSWTTVFTVASSFATIGVVDNQIFALYATLDKIIKSGDGFRTWSPIYTDSIQPKYGHVYPHNTLIGGNGQNVFYIFGTDLDFFACNKFMSYSEDGGATWHQKNGGDLLGLNVNDVSVYADHIVLAHDQGVSFTQDGLKTFAPAPRGLHGRYIDALTDRGGKTYANSWPEAFVSGDEGVSWAEMPQNFGTPCEHRYQLGATKKRLVLEDQNSIYSKISSDGGSTWRQLPLMTYDGFACSENCIWWYSDKKLMALSDADTTLVTINLTSTFNGHFDALTADKDGVLLKSGDGDYSYYGEDLQLKKYFPPPPCVASAQSINVNFSVLDGDDLYFFCGPNAFVFKAGAADWEAIYPQDWTTGVPLYLSPISFVEAHQGVLWVGLVGKGLYFSTDQGRRFYPFNPQMPNPYPSAILFRGREIWVATEYDGIYITVLADTVAAGTAKPQISLVPNPSDGHVQLESDVFLSEPVSLEVLDASARLVGAEILQPGQFWEVAFPGLPKGLYFLRLKTSAGVIGKKWVIDR